MRPLSRQAISQISESGRIGDPNLACSKAQFSLYQVGKKIGEVCTQGMAIRTDDRLDVAGLRSRLSGQVAPRINGGVQGRFTHRTWTSLNRSREWMKDVWYEVARVRDLNGLRRQNMSAPVQKSP